MLVLDGRADQSGDGFDAPLSHAGHRMVANLQQVIGYRSPQDLDAVQVDQARLE